jgi:thiamine pyrophosphate-dependent acetolactate synthase large subunit-like protein
VNFTDQRFSHVATAFGVFGAEVTRTEEVRPTLSEAVEVVRRGGCAVVDVHVSDEMAAGPLESWWPRGSAAPKG